MRNISTFIVIAIVLIVVFGIFWLTGIGFSSPTGSGIAPQTTGGEDVAIKDINAVTLGVHIEEGEYLVDPSGLTLYTTLGECGDNCFIQWIPYIAEEEVQQGDLGTIYNSDFGFHQYSWKGKVLYYFFEDTVSGDIGGNGKGGVWSLARP